MIEDVAAVTAICGLIGKIAADIVTSRKYRMDADLARQKERDQHQVELAMISQNYIHIHAQDVEKMRGLLDRGEFEQLAVMAHNIKGSGTMYGFPEITRMGRSIEASSKAQNNDTLLAQLQELTVVISAYMAAQKRIPPPPVVPPAPIADVPPAT